MVAGFIRWCGGDPPPTRRPPEGRAYRIFRAIMTETCEHCMAPLTVCRRSHSLADRSFN